MNRKEAVAECERWLAYLDRQKEKSAKIAALAAQSRRGEITPDEGRRQLRIIDESPTVYDGSRLADAVRVLIL